MKRYIITFILTIMVVAGALAQSDRDLIRQGNRLYGDHKYAEAEVAYRKAIAKNPNNSRAFYNLGCALQKQNRDSDAVKQYSRAVELEPNDSVRAYAYYNMGVALQSMKDYGKAIEAYKNCLRLNPGDNDARYDYVECKRKQKQQQQQNKNNNQQQNNKNSDKKDNNKEQKDKNEDKNRNNDRKQDNGQEQKGDMSRDNAEQLLQAAMNQEKQTEARIKKAMQQPSTRPLDKNW